MPFRVKEIFRTIQGEGALTGTPAIFVRFAGCNLWSGHETRRDVDARRHAVACPLFCDTDFRGGTMMEQDAIVDMACALSRGDDLIVLTGGEPTLQVTPELVDALARHFACVAMETNGTHAVDALKLDWVTVSPKEPVDRVTVRRGDEIKVVFPYYDPAAYEAIRSGFRYAFVMPADASAQHATHALQFCLDHPGWRLACQMHKQPGIAGVVG